MAAGSEVVFQAVVEQLREAGVPFSTPSAKNGRRQAYGLSNREMFKLREATDGMLPAAKEALARADVSCVQEQLDELLAIFRVNLDPQSMAYRRLGLAVLKRYVLALQAIDRRNQGEVVETPRAVEPTSCEPSGEGTPSENCAAFRPSEN